MTAIMDRTGIKFGGTDFAVLLNMRPYGKGHVDLYLEKIDKGQPRKATERMELGIEFEEPIAQLWARRNGVKIHRVNKTLVHPKWTWIQGHIDRAITGSPRDGLEVKWAKDSDDWGDPYTDQIPEIHIPQVQTYMMLKDAPCWQVAAFLCGEFGADLSEYTIRSDRLLQLRMVAAGEGFIENHLLPLIPPDPTNNEEAKRLYYAVEPDKKYFIMGDNGPTPEVVKAIVDHVEAKAMIKFGEDRLDAADLVLRTHMDKAELCMLDKESKSPLFTNKEQTQNRFDQVSFREDHPGTHRAYRKEIKFRKITVLKPGRKMVETFQTDMAAGIAKEKVNNDSD